MTKSKKINILLFSLMLVLSSLLFVACGKIDYSDVSLSASQEYLEVFVGQEESLTITIDNPVSSMGKLLTYTTSSNKCKVTENSHKDYSTTYMVTGVEGGNATITFVAVDGGASVTVDVLVRKYSENFSAKSDLLFITTQNQLMPSKNDFNFEDNVSEREVEFYFYGLYKENANLTLENVKDDSGNLSKAFVSVSLIERESDNKQYLIFKDKYGNLYTVAKSTIYTEDKLYFVPARYSTEDGYQFSDVGANRELYEVKSNDKFTFIARYQTKNAMGEDVELCAMKHFVVYDAISNITKEITYKDKETDANFVVTTGTLENTATVNVTDEDTVTFIPYYTPVISDKTVDFLTAYVVVKMRETNPFIKVKAYSEDVDVVTGKCIGVSEDGKSYCYELNCAQGNKASTNFVVQFYYEGLENADSELVNLKYKIPVEIRNIPKTLYINNTEYLRDEEKTDLEYVFYNHYAGTAGWQAFNVDVNPTNAEFSSFGLDLTDSGLTVRYRGIIYTADDLDESDGILYISDLSQTIYIRGVEGSEEISDAQLKLLVGIDILKEEILTYYLHYSIQKGATALNFIDGKDFEENGIYIDLNQAEIDFSKYLFTDADYQMITVRHLSGENIVSIYQDEKIKEENTYYVNLTFKPIQTGRNSFYQIILDNGVSCSLKVNVIETLNSITIDTRNENNLIKSQSVDEEGAYFYYVDNNNNDRSKPLDFYVYSNQSKSSQAISYASVILTDSSTFALSNQSADGTEFDLVVLKDGALSSVADPTNPIGLVVKAQGYIVEDFEAVEKSISCPINLYSYSYIDGVTTKQVVIVGGKEEQITANNTSVYTNVKSSDLRSITYSFDVSGEGYLFYDYASKDYVASQFDNKFIYWEITRKDATLEDGESILSYENDTFSIPEGNFIIDKTNGRLSFIAKSEGLQGDKEVFLLTHIRQFGKVFTYTTRIQIKQYVPVDQVSLQEGVEQISLSILNKETDLIAVPIMNGGVATDPKIGAEVVCDVDGLKDVFDLNNKWGNTLNIAYDEGTGKTYISLKITDDFLDKISGNTTALTAKLRIYAIDWLEQGNVVPDFQSEVLEIEIRFENGTENNRLSIKSVDDFASIKKNLSAHYQILGIIDASSVVDKMPFGELTGSIVGAKSYSKITGLNFTNKNDEGVGLFTIIAKDAYIENLSFEGSFNWTSVPTTTNIGLIAGDNNGRLENISVVINKSVIALSTQNFGGLVGINNGSISQDFSRYDDTDTYPLYKNCSPNPLVFFNNTMNITLAGSNGAIGGVAGVNTGSISKVISTSDTKYYGYTNYTAYTDILVSRATATATATATLGGVSGISSGTISGVLVGGLVSGYGTVGGVSGAGYKKNDDGSYTGGEFSNITTRTFVRSHTGAVALLVHTTLKNTTTGEQLVHASLSGKMSIQAVDDGRYGSEASMGIAYATEDKYATEFARCYGDSTAITSYSTEVYTYIARTKTATAGDEIKNNIDKTLYYGDFIVVNTNTRDDTEKLVSTYSFTSGSASELAVNAGFGNQMTTTSTENLAKVFYAYYFKVDSFAVDSGSDMNNWQNSFDKLFNTLDTKDPYYPFQSDSSDILFASKNPDVLTIDQNGEIVIKSTGLALIYVTSMLNTNEGLNFYIYVTNYFNTDDTKSIIYPNTSSSATAIDDTIISLRADNSAMLYIRPDYTITKSDETSTAAIKKSGNGEYQGIVFNLSQNSEVIVTLTYDENALKASLNGQTIYITKGEEEKDGEYTFTIQPILTCKVGTDVFTADVNKKLENTKIDYKKGALSIANKTYDKTSLYSSIDIEDQLIVVSTAEDEKLPVYQIIGLDGEMLQTNVNGTTGTESLFTVSISKTRYRFDDKLSAWVNYTYDETSKCYTHYFDLNISINTKSPAFTGRYTNNIYGEYTFTVFADSNLSKSTSFTFNLSKTNIINVPIDNHTKLSEAQGVLPTKSDKSYPGESGILVISVNPLDSDFDSVIIENDDINFTAGHSNAVFTLLARKTGVTGTDNLFESTTITGAQGKNGIEIRFDDIYNLYEKTGFERYNGIIYIRYDFSSENVLDESISRINVKFMKDGQSEPIKTAYKDLTIKLQNFVGIELVGKTKVLESADYYSAYTVARGLRYEIQINTYGFSTDNVAMVSNNENLGIIVKEGDKYYLEINSSSLSSEDEFNIYVVAQEGERRATSMTKITVKDFVLNYNSDIENPKNPDIVKGMGNGIINIQIGNQMTFGIDLYNYIEYDWTNNEIVNIIENFLLEISRNGDWTAHTNLEDDYTPNFDNTADKGRTYKVATGEQNANYYFKSNGLNVIPVHTHKTIENFYYFTLTTYYKESGTGYISAGSTELTARPISTKFALNVYTSSSEESPIPIYNYEEFSSMYSGSHYILMNDIVLPSDFTPLAGNFASFDGNGCTIHFEGSYDFGSAEELGIFTSIEDGTTVKNLNINFMQVKSGNKLNNVSITTSAENYSFGSLTATNNGIITNCHVFSTIRTSTNINAVGSAIDGNTDFVINASNAGLSRNYIAGISAANSGYISNCSVKLDIQSTASIAGIVSTNHGKIASTSYKGGKLIGEGANQNTAGFVFTNAQNAQIVTSYVSGNAQAGQIYSTGSYLYSSQPSAGFVLVNEGTIKDCYSDIEMQNVAARNAGFVYTNTGIIKNAFSLSIIKSNNTSSAGFAMENSGVNAALTNCYYLCDKDDRINTALAQVDKTFGITRLSKTEFANLENFAEFSYTDYPSTRSVWFYSNDSSSQTFVEQKITLSMGTNQSEIITSYGNLTNKTIATKRLELVSANIFAYSKRELDEDNIEIDNETGVETYHYLDSANAPNRGSINNPYLISTAQHMENLFMENSSATFENTSNYRIISDIDYGAEDTGLEGYSSLYKITFAGIVEGNGMEILGIGLVSMEQIEKAGLFAQIGVSASKQGSVKNLIISPREVAYSSAGSVGTLAGVLNHGYIYDITISVQEDTNMTVTGLYFVGGVVGRAINAFDMKDIYSNINASAGSNPAGNDSYDESINSYSNYSYAGSIAGYVGRGKVYNAYVSGVSSIMGGRAGFAYGGIGKDANVNYTYVTIQPQSVIRAYKYGGFIAGEVCGQLNYSSAVGEEGATQESFFATVPQAALAVGGIAGRLNGGKITNAVMNQPFKLVNDDSGKTIDKVGGLVGTVYAEGTAMSTIADSIVNSDITSCTNLGGAVGYVYSALTMDSIAVKSANLTVEGQKASPSLGGLIETVARECASVKIANAYCVSLLKLKTYTSGVQSFARASGFIANVENESLSMRSCYTTSKIEAEVDDIRKVDEPINFNKKGSDADSAGCLKKVSFQQKIKNDANIVDVYYLGSQSSGLDLDAYSSYTQGFVEFKAKSKSVEIGLIVNQYGMSSYQYISGEAATEEKAFYGLFGADYDYIDTDTGKHFMLRYNPTSKRYEAYDEVRKLILDEGYEYKKPWWLDSSATERYFKDQPCNILDIEDFEPPNKNIGNTSVDEIKRDVTYYTKESDGSFKNVQIVTNPAYYDGKTYLYYENETTHYVWDGIGFARWEGDDHYKDASGKKEYFDLAKVYKIEALVDKNRNPISYQTIYSYTFNPNNSKELMYYDADGDGVADPTFEQFKEGEYYCTAIVDTTKWTLMGLYKDEQNNVYKAQYNDNNKIVFVDIVSGVTVKEISSSDTGEVAKITYNGGAADTSKLCLYDGKWDAAWDATKSKWIVEIAYNGDMDNLTQIWNADSSGTRLTYLCIEDNLGWLNKR